MFRKRLVSLLSSILLALSAAPVGASAVETVDVDLPVIEVVTFAEQAAREPGLLAKAATADAAAPEAVETVAAAAHDPTVLVDEEQEGVGRVYVAVDEQEMTLTIGVGFEPAGVDQDVTVGAPGSGDEEPSDEAPAEQPSAQDTAAADDKAAMDQAKADAAAQAGATRDAAPAFQQAPRKASGTVASGSGTGRSVMPQVAPPTPDADTAADVVIDESNGLLRVFGALLLAGTTTVWGFARRNDLA